MIYFSIVFQVKIKNILNSKGGLPRSSFWISIFLLHISNPPCASAVRGRTVTHSARTNISDLLKLYCRVFSNVFWVYVYVVVSFCRSILGQFRVKANFKSESSRSLRNYETATHLAIIIFNDGYAVILKNIFNFFFLMASCSKNKWPEELRGAKRAQYNIPRLPSQVRWQAYIRADSGETHMNQKSAEFTALQEHDKVKQGQKNQTNGKRNHPQSRTESKHEQTAHKPGSREQAITNKNKDKNKNKNRSEKTPQLKNTTMNWVQIPSQTDHTRANTSSRGRSHDRNPFWRLWTSLEVPWGQKQKLALPDWTGDAFAKRRVSDALRTARIQQREEQVANREHLRDEKGELYRPDIAD